MGISLNAAQLLNGNGIDVPALVDQIQSRQTGILDVWKQRQADLNTEASLLGVLNTGLANLEDAINALKDPLGPLTAMSADSSMPAILTASAQLSAASGTHTVIVSALASAGTVYTAAIPGGADSSILPAGTTGGSLQLQIGGSGGTTRTIDVTKGSNDTLNGLSRYINQQSTQNSWGVTAAVLTDASGARLAIYSKETGTPGALAIAGNFATGTLNTIGIASPDSSILANGQNSGTIRLQIGGSSGTTADLAITAGSNDTLNTLATYINAQSTQNSWGVTASAVSDSGTYHLSLASSANGPAGALAFTANDTTLAVAANPPTSLSFVAPIGGTNAAFTIDGIPFSSTTNTVAGALPGVTLNLVSAEPAVPLQLSIGPDTSQARNAVQAFVVAYNTLTTAINHQFQVDPTTNRQGPLASDNSLRALQLRLFSDVNYAITGNSGLVNLASLGISMNDDGTLTVGNGPDGRTLDQVIRDNPAEFLNFFQNSSMSGFANNFSGDLISLTDSVDGLLNLDLAQNRTEQQNLADEITNFQDRLAAQRTSLLATFSKVNASLQSYPYLLQQLSSQLDFLMPSSSKKSSGSNQ